MEFSFKKSFFYLFFLSLYLLSSNAQSIPITTTVLAPEKFSAVRDSIIDKIENEELVSFSVAVTADGKIIWEESFGWADKEENIVATPNTIYPLGSLSKSIVATGLMKLINDGLINLEDDAEKYLHPVTFKSLVEDDPQPKVINIVSMTAGIPHGWVVYLNEDQVPSSDKEKNEFFNRFALSAFPPGEVFEYSNYSSGFVERLVEKVSGQSIEKYMTENIFKPIGMNNTLARNNPRLKDNITSSYSSKNNKFSNSFFLPTGGGGFFSSAHDLALYGMFHLMNDNIYESEIIGEEILDTMHYHKEEPSNFFTLGWFGDESKLISNGRIGGANSNIMLLPKNNAAVVCLTNKTTGIADDITEEIADIIQPGINEERAEETKDYYANFEKEYDNEERLYGKWSGIIESDEGKVNIALNFSDTGKVFVQIDKSELKQIEYPTFNIVDVFTGSFNDYLKTDFSRDDNPQNMFLTLKLKKNKLYGYITVRFGYEDASFSIPYLVKLKRAN